MLGGTQVSNHDMSVILLYSLSWTGTRVRHFSDISHSLLLTMNELHLQNCLKEHIHKTITRKANSWIFKDHSELIHLIFLKVFYFLHTNLFNFFQMEGWVYSILYYCINTCIYQSLS